LIVFHHGYDGNRCVQRVSARFQNVHALCSAFTPFALEIIIGRFPALRLAQAATTSHGSKNFRIAGNGAPASESRKNLPA